MIETIKAEVQLSTVVEQYTELRGGGNRLRAVENPLREGGDLDIYQDTQKYYDHGTGNGGDAIDFIQTVENLDRKEAISFLSEKYLNGYELKSNYVPPKPRCKPVKKDNNLLLQQIEIKANKYLSASVPKGTENLHRLTYEKYSIVELNEKEVVRIAPVFEKLLEGYLLPTDEKYALYLFNKVIGYDSYFDCPVIIVRDESEVVVDIVRYRPHRDGFTDLPKYLYTRNSEKPDSSYLFPLQAQMQLIMRDQEYCYIGEGLKNAINASIAGVPFISIEGAGNIKPELISFLKSDRMKDIVLIGAFDGDTAGKKAYKKINAEIPMKNRFDFESGIDFADFLKQIKQEDLNVS